MMENYIRLKGQQATDPEVLETAYEELRTAGMLKLKPEVLAEQEKQNVQQKADNIRKRSGGLSPRGGYHRVEPSTEDLYNMSDAEFAKLGEQNGLTGGGW